MTRVNTSARPKRSVSDALSIVTTEVTRLLEQGVMPWRAPWDPKLALAATPGLPLRFTGEPYRGANVVLLWAAQMARGYPKRTWLSYRQALQLGGHVRKGEKAVPVVFYGQAKAKDEKASGAGEQSEERTYRFLKLFYVFNVQQIDGLPETVGVETAPSAPVEWPTLYDWVLRAGAGVRVGGAVAAYSPATDAIHLPHISSFVSDEHWSATLAHETIHWTGAKSRLDRLGDYFTDRKARAREELTAECGSALICAMIGLAPDHLEDHAAYLADWLSLVQDEPRAFLAAAAKAQAAVDFLIQKAGHPSEAAASSTNNDVPQITQAEGASHAAL